MLGFTSKYVHEKSPGNRFCDTIENLWGALSQGQTHNIFALVAESSEEIEVEGSSQIMFGAVAFIRDARFRGLHIGRIIRERIS